MHRSTLNCIYEHCNAITSVHYNKKKNTKSYPANISLEIKDAEEEISAGSTMM